MLDHKFAFLMDAIAGEAMDATARVPDDLDNQTWAQAQELAWQNFFIRHARQLDQTLAAAHELLEDKMRITVQRTSQDNTRITVQRTSTAYDTSTSIPESKWFNAGSATTPRGLLRIYRREDKWILPKGPYGRRTGHIRFVNRWGEPISPHAAFRDLGYTGYLNHNGFPTEL